MFLKTVWICINKEQGLGFMIIEVKKDMTCKLDIGGIDHLCLDCVQLEHMIEEEN